jgi:hypothetical protein
MTNEYNRSFFLCIGQKHSAQSGIKTAYTTSPFISETDKQLQSEIGDPANSSAHPYRRVITKGHDASSFETVGQCISYPHMFGFLPCLYRMSTKTVDSNDASGRSEMVIESILLTTYSTVALSR